MDIISNKQKQEEAYVRLYLADCARIEQQQDDIKKQRKLLQNINEEIQADVSQVHTQLNEYAGTHDVSLRQVVTIAQQHIQCSQTQAWHYFDQCEDDLAQEARQLAEKYEERERQYKKDLRTLNESDQDRNGVSREPAT